MKKLLTQKHNISYQIPFVARRNTSAHQKRLHMIFMMTSSNDEKSDICQFFNQDLFHIVNAVYVQNFM